MHICTATVDSYTDLYRLSRNEKPGVIEPEFWNLRVAVCSLKIVVNSSSHVRE